MIYILIHRALGREKSHLKTVGKRIVALKWRTSRGSLKRMLKQIRPRGGYNSFVAPYNRHTYQVDLTFFSPSDFDEQQKYTIALTCTDVLSKYAVAIPIRSKEAPGVIAGTMQAINKIGGKSRMIYTDDEKAIGGRLFKEYVEDEGTELCRTRGRPAFIEMWNRSLKDMIFKRVEADEKKNKKRKLFCG